MRDSMRREIRKITLPTYSPLPFHPGKEKFMIFRKYNDENRYGNFLRHTFDKVRGITMRVRIVWSLLPAAAAVAVAAVVRKVSRAGLLSAKIRRQNRVRNFISAMGRGASRTRSKPHDRGRYIFPSRRGTGVIHRRETFYIMLTCARNGPLSRGLSSTRGRLTRSSRMCPGVCLRSYNSRRSSRCSRLLILSAQLNYIDCTSKFEQSITHA